MKSKTFKNFCAVCALLVALSVFSSCNRGVGCPSDFKAVVGTTISIIK